VTLQPVFRRIFGCSFLPDHDYGKGGKGWRDIWQDLLSLILIEPESVRDVLINNFAGVRIDGSNATIIGSKPGEFIADRNAISRVWMDHGVWPFLTTLLYVNQTGDLDLLFEETSYFMDAQMMRSAKQDLSWKPEDGNQLKAAEGTIYKGTILEHVLIQHLVQFFNVGDHNNIRLENADWNDGLDMAAQNGESVAFSSLYAGNLMDIADLLESLQQITDVKEIFLAKEMIVLLDTIKGKSCDYDQVKNKAKLLFDGYFKEVQNKISGEKVAISINKLVKDLRLKGNWIFKHIRENEKVTVGKQTWFNGYYDNSGKKVEGEVEDNVRLTLTGQTFPVMSGLATKEEIKEVVKSVNKYLKDKDLGGYRLNTDFKVDNYLDLGRAFGFAYGTKENGAFFSHMTVMYSFALYKRGFAREGYDVLSSIFKMSMDTKRSKIYPGIPEYFDSQGRGMYHYLTGSASWYVLTLLNEVFGIKSRYGDLVIAPKLVKEEFAKEGKVNVKCKFAGKEMSVTYENSKLLDYGKYCIKNISLNGEEINSKRIDKNSISIPRNVIKDAKQNVHLTVVLGG